MTLQEKRNFTKELIESIEQKIMDKTGKMPENWDGWELRQYVKDSFAEIVFGNMNRKRLKEYRNTVLIENLL